MDGRGGVAAALADRLPLPCERLWHKARDSITSAAAVTARLLPVRRRRQHGPGAGADALQPRRVAKREGTTPVALLSLL